MNPTRSANRTVTSRRSATGPAAAPAAGASPPAGPAPDGGAGAGRPRPAVEPGPALAAEPCAVAAFVDAARRADRGQPGAALVRRTCGRPRWACRRRGSSSAECTREACPHTAPWRAAARRQPCSSGMPARPRRRTRPAAARGRPRRRTRRRGRGGRSPTARAGSARSSRRRPAYSSDSVMSETVVSSVLSVTGTPARCSRASGCAATRRHDAGLPVRGRAQVEGHAAGRQLARTAPGRRRRPGPWAIRSGSIGERAPDLGRRRPTPRRGA